MVLLKQMRCLLRIQAQWYNMPGVQLLALRTVEPERAYLSRCEAPCLGRIDILPPERVHFVGIEGAGRCPLAILINIRHPEFAILLLHPRMQHDSNANSIDSYWDD